MARLVDELLQLGALASRPLPAPDRVPGGLNSDLDRGRGRPPTALTAPEALGQVIGVSFGLRRTVVLAIDLGGRELFRHTDDTPTWETPLDAVSWLAERICRARDRTDAPLRSVVVAVPARVIGGAEVRHPPLSMSLLEGTAFAERLSRALGIEVVLDSDANMALAGLTAEGLVPSDASPVLLSMSTVLTMAQRSSDGSTVQGRSDAFGNLALLPFSSPLGESTLGAMLSTHGLGRFCEEHGIRLDELSDLWDDPASATEVEPVREAFASALVTTLRIISVMIDPSLVLLVGRLAPLVQQVLPFVAEQLAAELENPPEVRAIGVHGTVHSTSHGAASIALARVHRELCARLAAGELEIVNNPFVVC